MCIGEPLGAGVVEVRQRALLERLRRILVVGNRPLRVNREPARRPLDPLRWVEPRVAQLDPPLSFQGYSPVTIADFRMEAVWFVLWLLGRLLMFRQSVPTRWQADD